MRPSFKFFFANWAALALAASLGVSACSGGSKETGSVEVVHWWTQGGEADAINALLGAFKKENPSVKVVDSSVDGSSFARAVIRGRMTSMAPPDTFQANGGWDLMAWVLYNGMMNDTETKMEELDPVALDLAGKVPPPVLDTVSYKGKLYAVPLNIHRLNTFFYNKKVFNDLGIDASQLKTLDDMFAAADKVNQYNEQIAGDPTLKPITPIALGYRSTDGDVTIGDSWTLALVFFENIIVARMGGNAYRDLFLNSQKADAFSIPMINALADFRRLVVAYSNSNAPSLTWNQPLDMVLSGSAAMTIMGDWGEGYAKAAGKGEETYGVIPTPGTAGTFVFTTDTFGLTIGGPDQENTGKLLRLFASQEGQDIFNPLKGSISARTDSRIDDPKYNYPAMAKQTFNDFLNADPIVPATSILAPQTYVDAISVALADFARARDNANPSIVQHTLEDYADILQSSCWPSCRLPPAQ